MAITVLPTPDFIKDIKDISKKHKGILLDIAKLSAELKINPTLGTPLGQNVFKIGLAISNTNKGKSGGARVITYVLVLKEIIYLSKIYLKNEQDTVDADTVVQRLKDAGLI